VGGTEGIGPGIILATTDGGATWKPQESATRQALSGISCVDSASRP
jgi:hypothetical protein